jgi:hypothetical protein
VTLSARDYPHLRLLIGAAGLDESVRYRLLNGQRRQVAAEFGLSAQELEVVMAIEAMTLEDLAQGLLDWMAQRLPESEGLGLEVHF